MARYRIGLMLGTKSTDYPRAVRLGVQNALEGTGHVLVPIADLIPYHTHANVEGYFRVAFELASRIDLDAIIVPAGTVAGYLDGNNERMQELVGTLDPAKTIVLERSIPGYRCITKDDQSGMHQCLRHLIETCGFTRIGFVSGSATSKGARAREAVYFSEMAEHGLEVRPSMFVRGDFSGECEAEVGQLIDENPDLEAIACASDLIAITTYHELHRRRLVVGRDIAVTGFDDHPKASHLDPPLSTVHLTGYDLGAAAAREAVRLCEGLEQQERIISGSFVARASCGERKKGDGAPYRELVRTSPFPIERAAKMLAQASLRMAGQRTTERFTNDMRALVTKVHAAYLQHLKDPREDDELFASHELTTLFDSAYHDHLSLEGLHSVSVALLDALLEEADPADRAWLLRQTSALHLRVARLISNAEDDTTVAINLREWRTLHLPVDALLEDAHPQEAYRLMLEELAPLGIHRADLFLLPETTTSAGSRSLALSDTLHHVGSSDEGRVTVLPAPEDVPLTSLLAHVLPRYADAEVVAVGGIMAGNELMGVMVTDPGSLSDNGQLMVLLNAGLALKHLQMMLHQREANEILSKNNLLLERQSQHDEMTGLLNRRGLTDGMQRALRENPDGLYVLFYCDLDGLKTINDSLGHDAGDDAIKATARVLVKALPHDCLLARMGGDEFVVFARIEQASDADALGQALQQTIQEFNETKRPRSPLFISYGSEVFVGHDVLGDGALHAMMKADERMYEMKKRSKESRRFAG